MKFYLIFHHNLAFSSIPKDHYPYIIEHLYDKLLDIAESGIPLGMEYTGETLEIIQGLRPDYIDRLKALINAKRVDFIGSSYSQAIFPLIPAEVNRWNLEFGLETYRRILDVRPSIALLNEQCYADSLPFLYEDYGYEAIVFDWMNARKGNNWPEAWRYQPVNHSPSGLVFLWSDCIAFQKFQRYVWGELDEQEWLDFIKFHKCAASRWSAPMPIFSIYTSDAEVFDYRPGSLATFSANKGHIPKIKRMLQRLMDEDEGSLLRPFEALSKVKDQSVSLPNVEKVCTPAYPVRTKKQDKYNVTRWAVTGRASSRMNTQCFKLFYAILDMANRSPGDNRIDFLKKELVRLWGSDFRTHTTDEKIEEFRNRMGAALSCIKRLPGPRPRIRGNSENRLSTYSIDEKGRKIHIKNDTVEITALKNKGLAIEKLAFRGFDWKPLLGTIFHGHFSDISLGADLYTGHIILLTQDGRQYTDLSVDVPKIVTQLQEDAVIIKNSTPMELPGLLVDKYLILKKDSFKIEYNMYAKDLRPASLRLGIFTFLPGSLERNTLFFETFNGGEQKERFTLKGAQVLQDAPVNHVVTCRHCLGNVTGELTIGDARTSITISNDPSELYAVPLIHYEEFDDPNLGKTFFLRVYYTICERDDVANVFWKGKMNLSFEVTAHGTKIKREA